MENWNKIADQKNLTEGPTWIEGRGLLYSECSASLTWLWDYKKKLTRYGGEIQEEAME